LEKKVIRKKQNTEGEGKLAMLEVLGERAKGILRQLWEEEINGRIEGVEEENNTCKLVQVRNQTTAAYEVGNPKLKPKIL